MNSLPVIPSSPLRGRALALFALTVALGSAARGEEALITDRPDFTESTAVLAPHRVQLEGGLTSARAGGEDSLELGELLLRIGLVDGLELRLSPGSWLDVPGQSGRGDAGVGFKVRLCEPAPGGPMPVVSFLGGASLPTAEDDLGSEDIEPEVKLLLAWELSERLGLAANFGASRPSADGRRFAQGIASVSLAISLTERWGAFTEAYAIFPEERGGDDTAFADAGLTYLLSDDVQLDLRVGRELRGDDAETYVGAGFAVRW